jgi:phosphoglycolate phosphatase
LLQEKTTSRVRLRTVVFDFDGTLAEFRLDFGLMKQRLAGLASHYLGSVPVPDRPVLEWLEHLEGEIRCLEVAKSNEFHSRAHRVIIEMELEAAREGVLFPFTRGLLVRLQQQGIHTAIITRNCAAAVQSVFPDMDRYCTCFLARDHVVRVKPHPEHLRKALERLGTSPEHSLMVGDHPLDVQTGKRAGTLTAGVASGSASWSELTLSGADWVASDCEALFHTLELVGLLGSF